MTVGAQTTSGGARLVSVIEQLVAAMGGKGAVEGAETEAITADGWRLHPGWGTDPGKPEKVAEFSYTLLEDTVRPRYRLALKAHTYLVPTELNYLEVGNGSIGHVNGIDFMFDPRPVDVSIPSWRVATRQRHFDLTSPLRLARKLLASDADLTLGIADNEHSTDSLILREHGRPPVRMHMDQGTGLLSRAEVTEEHSPLGDTLVEVLFSDYRNVGTLQLPYRVSIRVNGVAVHDEVRASIQVNGRSSDADFAVPDQAVIDGSDHQVSFGQYSTEWIMTYVFSGVRFYFDLQTAPVSQGAVDIAPGVKIVLGPSHNTLVVEMPDHVVAVEAPLYDEYTRSALTQVKAAFPGKPLKKVIVTHFHYDHVGGIREFVADGGLTVLAAQGPVPFFEKVFQGPHTVHPDRLEGCPVQVAVEGVIDSLILPMADGGNLELHHIRSDHADGMLIVYLSKPKIVFESDIWNPTPQMPPPYSGRGRLPIQLCEAIETLHLEVDTVVGGHSGTDGKTMAHAAPFRYLKTAAGL